MCSSKITPRIDPVFVSTIRELYRGPALVGTTSSRQANTKSRAERLVSGSCGTVPVIGHERLWLFLSPCRARILDHAALTNSSLILLGMGSHSTTTHASSSYLPRGQTDSSIQSE